jgi:hypothetical protein
MQEKEFWTLLELLMPQEFEECENLLYAAESAWVLKGITEEWVFEPTVSYESGSNAAAWNN